MNKAYQSWEDFEYYIKGIIQKLKNQRPKIKGIYAIPRGGLVIGVRLSHLLGVPLYLSPEEVPSECDDHELLIVDDISDTGNTFSNIEYIDEYQSFSLFYKNSSKFKPDFYCRLCKEDEWIVFPWERDGEEK
jgi:uncharacterized protein